MQMQPSAQGIASLYMGNPGALQQKIQKDQQAKPGLPPDLKKLMALNIVTNEQDAAKRQQAMNALNSMAPAGQEPPTVAQSLQEQAKQKLQAQMLQQQRQQQGLAALAKQQPSMEVPENTPQPETQPQGIDDLPVDMEFAGGGIVAFEKGDTVKGEPTREELEEQRRKDAEALRAVKSYLGSNLGDIAAKLGAAGLDIASLIPRGLAGAADTALIRPARAMGADIDYISPALTPGAQSSDTATPFYDRYIRAKEEGKAAPAQEPRAVNEPNKTRETLERVGPMTAPKFVDSRIVQPTLAADLKAAAEQRNPRPAPAPRPVPAPANQPAATPAAQAATPASGLDALYEQNIKKRMELDPEARANAIAKRLESTVGRADTSEIDRLMAELESRKRQFDAPKPGFEGFAEYMKQIAAAGPRRTWGEAGTAGAMALDALNKERRAQQFDLTKQGIEAAQKKLDLDRTYKKELFSLTEKERDEVEKMVGEATKEYGLSKRDAEKYKRDLELEKLRQKGAVDLEGIRARNAAANRNFDIQGELAKAILAGDKPRADKLREALATGAAAKRPGLDIDLLSKFEKLPGVKTDLESLSTLRSIREPKPAVLKQISDIEARLITKARANNIDPEQIGLGGVASSTAQTGTRTIHWNAIK